MFSGNASAQPATKTAYAIDSLSFELPYRYGSSWLDSKYGNTADELAKFRQALDDLKKRNNEGVYLQSINIKSSASPDGSVQGNLNVSKGRSNSAVNEVKKAADGFKSINSEAVGEDWDLLREIIASSNYDFKNEVLDIIDTKASSQERKVALKGLRNGEVWKTLSDEVWSKMRKSSISLLYFTEEEIEPVEKTDTVYVDKVVRETVTVKDTVEVKCSDFKGGLKAYEMKNAEETGVIPSRHSITTNLAEWALMGINIGYEYRFADNWTFGFDVYFNPFKNFWGNYRWRFKGVRVTPEIRYWPTFARGLYFGVYGAFIWGGDIVYGTHVNMRAARDYSVWAAPGLSIGFRLPLNRTRTVNLDLGIGVAYFKFNYADYNVHTHLREGRGDISNFVIDRAKVALVFTIPEKSKKK
ncbi:MAG: DUF3575 domain-containing protein [Bacteroidales bacterium]|nr:DUF3575 domain-containing protein [Bacteroidales bacterium]